MKGLGRNRLLHNLEYYPGIFFLWTEEKYDKSQASQCPTRNIIQKLYRLKRITVLSPNLFLKTQSKHRQICNTVLQSEFISNFIPLDTPCRLTFQMKVI
jgi:hypothetical protein